MVESVVLTPIRIHSESRAPMEEGKIQRTIRLINIELHQWAGILEISARSPKRQREWESKGRAVYVW